MPAASVSLDVDPSLGVDTARGMQVGLKRRKRVAASASILEGLTTEKSRTSRSISKKRLAVVHHKMPITPMLRMMTTPLKKGQACVRFIRNKHRILACHPKALRVVVELKDPGAPSSNAVQFIPCVLASTEADGLCRPQRFTGGSGCTFFFKEFRDDDDAKAAQQLAQWNENVKTFIRDHLGLTVPDNLSTSRVELANRSSVFRPS